MRTTKLRRGLDAIALLLATHLAFAQEYDIASKLYAATSKSVFLIVLQSPSGEIVGQATAFSVDGNQIVTNEHVVRAGKPYLDLGTVRIGLDILYVDITNDLAVLMPTGELTAPALKLAAVQPKPGSAIFAIGNPEGLEKTISTGVIAGLRTINGRELLQISAPISHGSSGGPIFNARGEVVGVTAGMLDGGQNLNFAIPSSALLRLLRGEAPKANVRSLLKDVDDLSSKQSQETYSDEPDSSYQQLKQRIERTLSQAITVAGSNRSDLALVADKAIDLRSPTSVAASERLVEAAPTALAYTMLAKSLKLSGTPDELKNAEEAILTAFRVTKAPTTEMYAVLADILEDRNAPREAREAFYKTYQSAQAHNDIPTCVEALRGLVRTSFTLKSYTESDRYFQALLATGKATAFDWHTRGGYLGQRNEFLSAADSYKQAAPSFWTDWCRAAASYSVVGGAEDKALETARACIENAPSVKGSDVYRATAHHLIAEALNDRGVFEEALSHARESFAISPGEGSYYNELAVAFNGLGRFEEAISAAKQGIRLSDGRYSWMHFTLGSAYFATENWTQAEQSFTVAAKLEPTDDAPVYNVAICLQREGFFRDAAAQYEEVLRRNPNRKDRQQILELIRSLRK